MMGLVETSLKRPVFAVMIIASLVALGWLSIGRLGVDLFPDVEFPYVSVTTPLEGASPETVESEISDVIEGAVNTISGIEQLRSSSSDGLSQVFIEFSLDEDIDVKAQDVRDQLQTIIRELPVGVETPVVAKVDPDASPILSIIVSGDLSIREITQYADDVLKERIQTLPGVGSVRLLGGRERVIRIWLNNQRLRAYGLTAMDVQRAIQAENSDLPGGRLEIDNGRIDYGARTMAEVRNLDEFRDLVVAHRANGAPTRLGDVARIEDGLEDERSLALLNGQTGVSLEIRRQSGRNTVEVAHTVVAALEGLRASAPDGLDITVARDVTRFIESSIDDVTHEIQMAMILVVIVVFAFLLNFRATFIVAIAIPTSLIATFFAFYIFGFTINLLTLLALTVAIGLLVDDAIVVIEAITKELENGADPMTAAREGTRKVGLAVLAGTFATLAVFVPIAFMSGIVGRFFFQYGLAIVFSVSVSLLVALTLTPMLSSRWLRHSQPIALLKPIQGFWDGLDRAYGGIVNWCVKWRYLVILLGFATLPIGGYFAAQVPSGFTSNADRSEFQGTLELPLGIGITQTREAAQAVSDALGGLPEVENVFVTAGSGARNALNQINFLASMTPKQSRDMTQETVMELARQALSDAVPQARDTAVVEVPWISGGGITSFEIDLRMRGADLDQIDTYAQALMDDMRQTDFFVDTQSSLNGGRPEVQVQFDRLRGGDLGVPASEMAMVTRIAVGGTDVSTFEADGHRYDVRLRLEDDQRQDLDALRQIQVRSRSGQLVDLGNVSNIEITQGLSQIDRQDRSRMISVLANTAPGVALGDAFAALERLIEARPPPAEVTLTVEGQARRMQDSIQAITYAFMLALIALYIVLSSQFNSFVQPLLIMITAPLSFSGAFAALYYADQEMSLFAQIGMLALMGIVMKNGILLVDRANQLREEGLDPVAAIRKACPERLRPVLMTAFSAIFGLIPVALAQSDGAEWRNALGFIIIGGLASSTVLTMLVLPSVYAAMADIGRVIGGTQTLIGDLLSRSSNHPS